MVRIVLHRAGIEVNDTILAALTQKCLNKGLLVTGNTLRPAYGILIVNTDHSAAAVINILNADNRATECPGCNTAHFRGDIPDASAMWRCMCGAWHNKPKKQTI